MTLHKTLALVTFALGLVLVCQGFREDPKFPVGSKWNPGQSCKDIKERGGTATKNYFITLGQQTLLVYCDQETLGGGWTLVYSYNFTDFSNFGDYTNAVTPRPNWKNIDKDAEIFVPVSTTTPRSETDYNAMDFKLWKQVGTEFLVKSNINNWIACREGTGSFVNYVPGTIKCKLVKNVIGGPCTNTIPDTFLLAYPKPTGGIVGGPLLCLEGRLKNGDARAYYYFESENNKAYPTHDPCGMDNNCPYQQPANPHGNIYIR